MRHSAICCILAASSLVGQGCSKRHDDCEDGSRRNERSSECAYEGTCLLSGSRTDSWQECVAGRWAEKQAVVECQRQSDGSACDVGAVCQSGACIRNDCAAGSRRNVRSGECAYEGTCLHSGSRTDSWQECVAGRWEEKQAVVECQRQTDGSACDEGAVCQSGVCIKNDCAAGSRRHERSGECAYEGTCLQSGSRTDSWQECVAGRWEEKQAVVECQRQTDGSPCEEGAVCQSGVCNRKCVDGQVRNGVLDACQFASDSAEIGERIHRFERCQVGKWVLVEEKSDCCRNPVGIPTVQEGAPATRQEVSVMLQNINHPSTTCTGTFIAADLIVSSDSCLWLIDKERNPRNYHVMRNDGTEIAVRRIFGGHAFKNNVNLDSGLVDLAYVVVAPENESRSWAQVATSAPPSDYPWMWSDVEVFGYHQTGVAYFGPLRMFGSWGFDDEEVHLYGTTPVCAADGGTAAYDDQGRLFGIFSRRYFYFLPADDCSGQGGGLFVDLTKAIQKHCPIP